MKVKVEKMDGLPIFKRLYIYFKACKDNCFHWHMLLLRERIRNHSHGSWNIN